MNAIIKAEEGHKEFFPTPKAAADLLLEGLDFDMIDTVLEPSAGTGELIMHFLRAMYSTKLGSGRYKVYRDRNVQVSFLEKEPDLRAVCKSRFNGETVEKQRDTVDALRKTLYDMDADARRSGINMDVLEKSADYMALQDEYDKKEFEYRSVKHCILRCASDDFLTFENHEPYDLILMNPPFSDGDAHLLKALDIASEFGGEVRCILNAETVRNPYTRRRQYLLNKLSEYGADISFHSGLFKDAERKTDVEVAIIKVTIPAEERESEIFNRMKRAEDEKRAQEEASDNYQATDMVEDDVISKAVSMYNVELNSGIELIKTYLRLRPYITSRAREKDSEPIISIKMGSYNYFQHPERDTKEGIRNYIEMTRNKYWRILMENKQFTGNLTSDLQSKYQGMLAELRCYEFNRFNIEALYQQMCVDMCSNIQDTIQKVFSEVTDRYSQYEGSDNCYLYNGWKTNKAWKVNPKKVILPYRAFSFYDSSRIETYGHTVTSLTDIEKVLDYFNGKLFQGFQDWNAEKNVSFASKNGITRNVDFRYWTADFYKKGTVHLKWKQDENVRKTLDAFNIYCSKLRGWLPPCYGTTSYTQMEEDAQAVVDSFHGDGSKGSGEEGYAVVLQEPQSYLVNPTASVTGLLPEAE